MPRHAVEWLAALALASACTAPPPLAEPMLAPRLSYERSGQPTSSSPQGLHIELWALAAAPPGIAVDLAARTIASAAGAPFQGASSLPPGSRWLAGAAADAWCNDGAAADPAQRQPRGAAEAVVAADLRTRARVELAGVPDLVLTIAADAFAVQLQTRGERRAAEAVQLAAAHTVALPFVLFVPQTRPANEKGAGAALRFAGHALVVTARDASTEAAAAARTAAAPMPPTATTWPAPWQQAFAAIGEHNRRPALLAIARPLGEPRVRDLLMVADEAALIAITEALRNVDPHAADLAWQFERATWTALLPRLERDDLSPALHAAALRHLGAAANDATWLRVALAGTDSCTALSLALRDENELALADRDAPQRVRAHDWLAAAGFAVPGFDPLGDERQRRAALRAHARARAIAEAPR